MSRRPNHKTFRPASTPAPAAAGHRPLLLAVALAAGFSAGGARAQPAGAQAIMGTASVARQGSTLLVTTTNAPGTSFSSINWQSFSVPAGTTTHFAQPGATSTSINRVLGPDPSAIFGTLSSNGRLVLVNPAGITVGAGAVVDTAAFTASTLRMSDADALAGRLRFAGGDGAALRVDGQVLARSGDVVLVGQDVQAGAQALLRSPQGATILAAGQKVEVTGRGLEGIVFEVQAPADQALNLGTLAGDAVGVFAGTLKHTGLIQAQAVSTEGGKVVLRAADVAQAGGAIRAQGLAGAGGSVDVLGDRVGVLAGATIDTSGSAGGGRIRIGGGAQGRDADVRNAQVTYVAADAQLRANATDAGDGGTVVVWADDTTRAYGRIEARGGASGGHGGFVETSGKRALDVNGIRVDASAPQGAAGTWLLDPTDIYIVAATPAPSAPPVYDLGSGPDFSSASSSASTLDAATLNRALTSSTNVTISISSAGSGNGDIVFSGESGNIDVVRGGSGTLSLQAQRDIRFQSGTTSFQNAGTGTFDVQLQAGNGILTDSGATVHLSTTDPSAQVRLTVRGGKTWANNGTLVVNQNGLVSLDGATFVNNGSVSGSAGASGGIGGTLGTGTFENNGSVSFSQGVFKVGTLRQTPAPTTAPQPNFWVDSGTQMQVSSNFAVTGGTFSFYGSSLAINQAAGDLNLDANAVVSATGAVQMTASGGSINVAGDIDARSLTLKAGNTVSYANLYTYGDGSIGTAGGSVTIVGSLGVSGGDILADGYAVGNGGAISIRSSGPISVGYLSADGGVTSSGSAGRGGSIDVASSGGPVTLSAASAMGGDSSLGAGGGGGSVTISGPSVNVGYVTVGGGSAGDGSGANGGDAGSVRLAAGSGGLGGLGGVFAVGGYGGSAPGAGGRGGKGGTVDLSAAGGTIDLTGVGILAYGGSGGSGGTVGGAGGAGGSISITASAGGVLTSGHAAYSEVPTTYLEASGGWGGDTSGIAATDRGGAGGAGGRIAINANAGSELLGFMYAEGGVGGTAGAGNATGGAGGTGGAIALNVAGTTPLAGDAMAGGGAGGRAYDSSGADDATRFGTTGAGGAFTTSGGTYTVPVGYMLPTTGAQVSPYGSSFNVGGTWTNNATVVLQPYAWVMASQGVTNNGVMDLGAGSVLSLGTHDTYDGTFTPGSGAFTNGASGVLQGRGTLEGSLSNAGTLRIGDTSTSSDPAYTIGTFTILGNLVQQPTGRIEFDVAANTPSQPGATYDQLVISGTAVFDGALQVNMLPEVTVPAPAPTPAPTTPPLLLATALAGSTPADSYVLLDVQGGASGAFTLYAGPGDPALSMLQMNNAGTLMPIPRAVPTPAPTPVPSVLASDPLVDRIVDLLGGSATGDAVQGALSEQDNLVTNFLDKLLDEEQKQKDAAKGEIVYTDAACKPS